MKFNLMKARAELGITQAELAEAVGVAPVTVNSWEKGTRFPRPKNVLALSRVLGMSFEDIYEGEGAGK